MEYRVSISPVGESDIDEIFRSLARRSMEMAYKWFGSAMGAIHSLTTFPERCAVLRENELRNLGVRRLAFGKGSMCYHILFLIEPSAESGSHVVRILRVRYAARQAVTSSEIEEGLQ